MCAASIIKMQTTLAVHTYYYYNIIYKSSSLFCERRLGKGRCGREKEKKEWQGIYNKTARMPCIYDYGIPKSARNTCSYECTDGPPTINERAKEATVDVT